MQGVPCLTYVFSLPYLLYHHYEPNHDEEANSTGDGSSKSPSSSAHFMDRAVFTDFKFPEEERPGVEEGVQVFNCGSGRIP